MAWMWIAATWPVLAVVIAVLVGRSIRMADRREPDVVVDEDPPAAPLPPLDRAAGDGHSMERRASSRRQPHWHGH